MGDEWQGRDGRPGADDRQPVERRRAVPGEERPRHRVVVFGATS